MTAEAQPTQWQRDQQDPPSAGQALIGRGLLLLMNPKSLKEMSGNNLPVVASREGLELCRDPKLFDAFDLKTTLRDVNPNLILECASLES